MFFKFFIYKVEGNSMSPSIENNSFILMKSFKEKKINKFFVFKHQIYGKLIKNRICEARGTLEQFI